MLQRRLSAPALALLAVFACLAPPGDGQAQPLRSPFRELPRRERTIAVQPQGDRPASSGEAGRLWAVIVGVNEYTSRNIPKLQFAVNDARAVRDRIIPRIPTTVVQQLHLENAQATKHRILDAIEDLANAHPEDTVLVYFSMHGVTDRAGRHGFLVSHDADPWNIETTGVPIDTLLRSLSKVPAKQLFLILDTCYSGSAVASWGAAAKSFAFGPSTRAGVTLPAEIYDAVKSRRGHFVVSAARPDETSLELEVLGHGLFTYFLLEALDGLAARPGNNFVTVSDVYDYVSNRVGLVAKNLAQPQTPMMKGDFDGPPPVITLLPTAPDAKPSDLEKLIREARLSFESSRLIVTGNPGDRIELFLGGSFHESWKAPIKEIRIPKELFARHGNEIQVTVRVTREGRKAAETTFRLPRGEERRITIETSEAEAPPAPRPWRPVFPTPPS